MKKFTVSTRAILALGSLISVLAVSTSTPILAQYRLDTQIHNMPYERNSGHALDASNQIYSGPLYVPYGSFNTQVSSWNARYPFNQNLGGLRFDTRLDDLRIPGAYGPLPRILGHDPRFDDPRGSIGWELANQRALANQGIRPNVSGPMMGPDGMARSSPNSTTGVSSRITSTAIHPVFYSAPRTPQQEIAELNQEVIRRIQYRQISLERAGIIQGRLPAEATQLRYRAIRPNPALMNLTDLGLNLRVLQTLKAAQSLAIQPSEAAELQLNLKIMAEMSPLLKNNGKPRSIQD